MVIIIGQKVRVFTQPLGQIHQEGYAVMVKRVCQVWQKKMNWTGFIVVKDSVLTTGFYPHGKEFDLIFQELPPITGFTTEDWGEVIELGAAAPSVGSFYTQGSPIAPGQVLFSIGSFFGIPYTLVACEVEKVLIADHVMNDQRLELLDEHSAGSPVFNQQCQLVGILEAYIEKTDRMVIRSLTANASGLLKG